MALTRNLDTRSLTAVALGRLPADLVIQNGRWVCVQSGEIVESTDIAILGDTIAFVGPDASHLVGQNRLCLMLKIVIWCLGCWTRTCISNLGC
jgi:adenine deaminase